MGSAMFIIDSNNLSCLFVSMVGFFIYLSAFTHRVSENLDQLNTVFISYMGFLPQP